MRKLPALNALRVFEAAARRLSFKDAADELHVTPTAVSHQIKLLEETLDVELFERSARKVRLTAAGLHLYPILRDGFDRFERALENLRDAKAPQLATITSTVAFMARRLAPRTGAFKQAYPDWSLRLDARNTLVDLEIDADAAIRYGSGRYADLEVEHLFQDRFAPVCSPHLHITSPEDLQNATLIHFEWGAEARDDERACVWRHWIGAAKIAGVDINAGLSFTEELHAVQATIAGQGIGLLSLELVKEELASGVLVQPFELELDSFSYDLVYSPRAIDRPATMLIRDWVKDQFEIS